MKQYHVNEVFLSVQGEGARAGTLDVFVRFAHCNLQCSLKEHGFDCDTDYSGSMKFTATELLDKVQEIGQKCKNIIFTGGEPALQLDPGLTALFHDNGYYLAVETNGTKDLQPLNLDWISCSPKTAEHTLICDRNTCHELRYVLAKDRALPNPKLIAEHYYLSPVFNPDWSVDYGSLTWILRLIKENPTWKMSLQAHKLLQLR